MKFLIGLLLLCVSCLTEIEARVKLPTVIGDNMVLQQLSEVNLWGKACANAPLTVQTSWNKKVYKTSADKEGNWLLKVSTPVSGGPYRLTFNDGESLTLKNVLIGEVWVCTGQSNMEMPVGGYPRQPIKGSNDILAKAKPATPLRLYTTDSKDGNWIFSFDKKPQEDCLGEWLENTPENVSHISAVSYYFARYIQEVLNVPVGIIVTTRGGSKVEAWMSREALEQFGGVDLSALDSDKEVTSANATVTPCVLYNAKIAPLVNFSVKGFLWYQGESNCDNPELYKKLMPAFVSDLRARWGMGELPFYFVQIAPYTYGDPNATASALLREAQVQNMKDIPNCGMVTTIDTGEPFCIHPSEKEVVGNRLAYWALALTYGMKGFGYAPPIYKSMKIEGNKAFIDFDNAPQGVSPVQTSLKEFEIAGEDKIFYPAFARVNEVTGWLEVSSDKVPAPVAVRYAFKNYSGASLYGIHGIPASPFRTDNW